MERCTSSDEIRVQSDSSTKEYVVSFTDILPTCTCVAFAIGRNRAKSEKEVKPTGPQQAYCKHIDRVFDKACRWRGETLMPGFHVCPECGSKTVPCEEMSIL